MKIDLSTINDSVWQDYPKYDGVRFLIRPLSASKNREIEQRCTKKSGEIDKDKLNKELPDYIIEDWEGIVDQQENPIPCTLEMKVAILDYFHDMRLWLLSTSINLADIQQEEQKKKETPSSGT